MLDLNDLVEQRRKERARRKKKIKIYLSIFTFLILLLSINLFKKFLDVSVDYDNIVYNQNLVSRVNMVDDLTKIEDIIQNNKYRYIVQGDIINNNKELLKFSKSLSEGGVDNFIVKDGKTMRLNIIKGFDTIEEAEKYGVYLLERNLLNSYTVRIR